MLNQPSARAGERIGPSGRLGSLYVARVPVSDAEIGDVHRLDLARARDRGAGARPVVRPVGRGRFVRHRHRRLAAGRDSRAGGAPADGGAEERRSSRPCSKLNLD